jgi:hypothetical protein
MYIIKSSNCKPIVVHKAQDKKDAIQKAENCAGKELKVISIKFYDGKKQPDFPVMQKAERK